MKVSAAGAAAPAGRLIRPPRVMRTTGRPAEGVAAAKEKPAAAGIADRPAAGLLGQFKNGPALADRNDVIDQFRCGLRLHFIGVGERSIAADRSAADAHHRRARLAWPRRSAGCALGAAG